MKKMLCAGVIAATTLLATNVQAKGIVDMDALYVGGGLSINSMSGAESAMGFQGFAGLPLAIELGIVDSAVEVGYMNSGDMDVEFLGRVVGSVSASGLWANYVATMNLSDQLQGIGRIGLDFGDDDGLMYGVGVGYGINEQMDVRGEYVARDNINSLQVNLVYRIQ